MKCASILDSLKAKWMCLLGYCPVCERKIDKPIFGDCEVCYGESDKLNVWRNYATPQKKKTLDVHVPVAGKLPNKVLPAEDAKIVTDE